MDLIRTLLVYMAMLLSTSAVTSPALTPLPPNFMTPSPSPTVTMQPTRVPVTVIPTFVPTAAPTRTPTLAMGDRGENVRVLQVRLQELGYLTGRVDSIFGRQTKQALERFQRYNNLSVDGIAGAKTNQKLYNDRNVIRAPVDVITQQPPVLASVPVYYRNSKGVLLGSDTVLVAQGSLAITPNARLVPSNHSLISQNSVTVRVDERGRANPSSVSFTYQANSEVRPVVIPVFYRTDTNITLATDSISVMPGQTLTFTADASKIPSGYTLMTAGKLTVNVSSLGIATPGTLTFIYKKDAISASVSVNYRDSQDALLGQETKVFSPGTHTVTANGNAIPSGYTLQGANTQQVVVSADGIANPPIITFVYKTNQVTVQVPIEYIDAADSSILYSDKTSVISGQSVQVVADNSRVPADYVLSSNGKTTITVNAQGVPTPQKAVFTYRKLASAQIDVLYKLTDGTLLRKDSILVTEGANTISANDGSLTEYIRQGIGQKTVTVATDGTVSPNEVVFLYVAKEAVPVTIDYIIEYVKAEDETALLGNYIVTLGVGTHQITAKENQLGDYLLLDVDAKTVTVAADGTADPAKLTFRFALPEQPPDPISIDYPIEYVQEEDETAVISSYTVPLGEGTHQIGANDAVQGDRTLIDTETKTVTVAADGTADPAKLTFKFALPEQPPDPISIDYPIEYVQEEDETAVISSYTVPLGEGTHQIGANDAVQGDRTLIDTETKTVTVAADGTADPAKLVFRFALPEQPPEPISIDYPIEYVQEEDETAVISSYIVPLGEGTYQIGANDAVQGDRTLIDTETKTVTVAADGTADPAKLTFKFALPEQPPEPISIDYTIEYVQEEDETAVISSYTVPLGEGTHQIGANDAVQGDRTLVETETKTVTVAADGTADPAKLTFKFALPEQPPEPISIDYPIEYVQEEDETAVISSYTVTLAEGTHQIGANDAVQGDRTLVETETKTVTVAADGTADPAKLTFRFALPEQPPEQPPIETGMLPAFIETSANEGSYSVYTGPGEGYYRVNNATLGGGIIRVYGQQNNLALIGYGLSNGGYRIGFVSMEAIPQDIVPPELQLTYIPMTNVSGSLFVDDPIVSENRELSKNYEAGNPFYLLAYLGDQENFWAYVEIENFDGSGLPARGFVSKGSLGL